MIQYESWPWSFFAWSFFRRLDIFSVDIDVVLCMHEVYRICLFSNDKSQIRIIVSKSVQKQGQKLTEQKIFDTVLYITKTHEKNHTHLTDC